MLANATYQGLTDAAANHLNIPPSTGNEANVYCFEEIAPDGNVTLSVENWLSLKGDRFTSYLSKIKVFCKQGMGIQEVRKGTDEPIHLMLRL